MHGDQESVREALVAVAEGMRLVATTVDSGFKGIKVHEPSHLLGLPMWFSLTVQGAGGLCDSCRAADQ